MYLQEKAMATHSSTLAWKIPWAEKSGRLQSMGSWRVGHDWATSLSLFTFMHWRWKCNPLLCSCLENPRDGKAWWATIYGVAQSRTRLKWLSSSSSMRQSWEERREELDVAATEGSDDPRGDLRWQWPLREAEVTATYTCIKTHLTIYLKLGLFYNM